MSVEKLQQDILRCQHVVSEITIKHYHQDNYKEIVMKIFTFILLNPFVLILVSIFHIYPPLFLEFLPN